jgi:hypothetical protein
MINVIASHMNMAQYDVYLNEHDGNVYIAGSTLIYMTPEAARELAAKLIAAADSNKDP